MPKKVFEYKLWLLVPSLHTRPEADYWCVRVNHTYIIASEAGLMYELAGAILWYIYNIYILVNATALGSLIRPRAVTRL